jgi:hypothetical protein
MPGKSRTLRVVGTCHAPRTGYEFELRRKEGAQGINPNDLLLELDVHRPEVGNEVLTDYAVEYVEETDTEYDTVTIIGVATSIRVVHTE